MKLNYFKFQDGKVFWLPEYPERPVACVWDSMDIPELCIIRLCECAKEATIHSIAVAQSLASAIEVAPEDREKIRFLIWDDDNIIPPSSRANFDTWQPEKDKVYSAECEMLIEWRVKDANVVNGWYPISKEVVHNHRPDFVYQVAHLKPMKEHLPKRDTSSRDWPEDFDDENGNYQNVCIQCKLLFYGNKHRVICKKCQDINDGWISVDSMKSDELNKEFQKIGLELNKPIIDTIKANESLPSSDPKPISTTEVESEKVGRDFPWPTQEAVESENQEKLWGEFVGGIFQELNGDRFKYCINEFQVMMIEKSKDWTIVRKNNKTLNTK